ncbi:MAG: UDP-glucose/GDP-mannose dehydrogenase family protein [Vampirovibrionales bacterium]|nr:UDP-glucose/GDP-mannose dehydrogenase family protein [Vampirovibrionales bacterium]
MRIGIVGTGYVGSVTGSCLAELGHDVLCADLSEDRIMQLQRGEPPFFENDLEPLLKNNLANGRLKFTTSIADAVKHGDVVFLCIGTKPLPDGRPDMTPMLRATSDIASAIDGYKIIVEKSTLPIQSAEWLAGLLREKLPAGGSFDIAAVPQFLREGTAVKDFFNPDRTIIGVDKPQVADVLVELFAPLNGVILVTDINSAEIIKHATSAFLATKLSFMNAIAQLCEKTGADVTQVAKGLGMDHRIGAEFLNAGIGYGGIFFQKDIASLIDIGSQYHINLDLLKATTVINRYQRIQFIERIEQALAQQENPALFLPNAANQYHSPEMQRAALSHDLHGKTIAIWGLAYKPHTNDLRDAPSISIIWGLQNRGAHVRAYDPLAMPVAKSQLPKITFCDSPYEAAQGADVIAIVTEWDEFKEINFKRLREVTQTRLIVDGRNLYNPQRMADLGFNYVSIGRATAFAQPNQAPESSDVVSSVALPGDASMPAVHV